MTIDEDKLNAMARTAQRKISTSPRASAIIAVRNGLREEDLMFDPLVLPISTGIEEDRRNALETIEGHPAESASGIAELPHDGGAERTSASG